MFAEFVHLLLVILSGVKLVMLPLLLVLDLLVPDVHRDLVAPHLPGDLGALLLLLTALTVIPVTVLITLMLLVILGIVLIISLLDACQLGQPVLDLAAVRLGLVPGQSVRQLSSHLRVLLLEVHLLDAGQRREASPLTSSVPPPLLFLLLISAQLSASS